MYFKKESYELSKTNLSKNFFEIYHQKLIRVRSETITY
jgi:hypothetical protein